MRNRIIQVPLLVVFSLVSPAVNLWPAQAPSSPVFEVASVKSNKAGGASVLGQAGGSFTATNVTARELLRVAYGIAGPLEDSRLVGGPGWTGSDRYDLLAKIPDNAPPQLVALMLRSLLAERFQLVVHTEPRNLPIYALVMSRADGTLGPHLRPVQDCGPSGGGSAAPSLPKAELCGGQGSSGHLTFGGIPLSMGLVTNTALLREVRRIVVDRTGLTGAFEGTLDWTPADGLQTSNQLDALSPPPPDGASIFTAIQEQLGLKLVSSTGPVEVVVIDKIEHPTEN
jgi:uncharacterized protein (TIGR03435 family)